MSKLVLALLAAAILIGGARAAPARPDGIAPGAARDLTPVQPAVLIASLLPPKGAKRLSWDYVRSAPIRWMSAGPQRDRDGVVRKAVARVRIGRSWGYYIHNGRRIELAWWITLRNRDGPASGPQVIEINPGSDAGGCSLKWYRMENGFGCVYYPSDALVGGGLHSRRLCTRHFFSDEGTAYRVWAPGRHSAILVYGLSYGTGFATSSLEIYPFKADAAACADLKKDYAYGTLPSP